MRDKAAKGGAKLRSRAYPGVALPECVELLERLDLALGAGGRNRSSIAQALGYAGESGVAARKAAALVHFGLMDLRGGLYWPTALAEDILKGARGVSRRLLQTAFLNPSLFREIVLRYEPVGRVPRQLALTLSLDHGIQEAAREEAAQIFLQSALHAGVLESDGSFRDSYFEDTLRPMPLTANHNRQPRLASAEVPEAALSAPDSSVGRTLRFPVTDQKEVIIHIPPQLNEQDILLLRTQIDFLDLQVKQNRPDQPVRLDVYRRDRKR